MNPFNRKKEFLNNLKTLRPTASEQTGGSKKLNCKKCGTELDSKQLVENRSICFHCGYYFPMSARRRIDSVFDEKAYKRIFEEIGTTDPLNFPGYKEKISGLKEKTGLSESVVCATGNIGGVRACVIAMDTRFLMGSLAAATGEKIALTFEYATKRGLPVIIFNASGGARMQEGIFSLFQMAKTSFALRAHSERGLLYLSVMTNPTTGGVTASYASLGDIIIAEPNALIGFAGPRVIEQTIKQKLPEGFQSAEFVQECGFVDMIVERAEMKETIEKILKMHSRKQ